jgi:hypothetical protein
MKNLYYIISFLLVVGLFGCDDFLTVEPENDLIIEEYWKSKDDVQGVIIATYASLKNTYDEMFRWGDLRGGNLTAGNSPGSSIRLFFEFNIYPSNSLVKWKDFYKVINYTNTLLEYAPQVVDLDPSFSEADLKYAEAEAKFVRALCYFQLVKAFRDVPLVLEPYDNSLVETAIKKNREEEIISQIISDLIEIRSFVPKSYSVDDYYEDAHNKGRATIYAVDALLADVYLWDNQYDNCIKHCDYVIDSYKFGLVAGENYFSIFSPGNSIESIFEAQTMQNVQSNNLFDVTGNVSGTDKDVMVHEEFTELYSETEDLRGSGVSYDASSFSIWKYVGYAAHDVASARTTGSQSDANWIYYRLSDLHLMKAEAYCEEGNFVEANNSLNIVRGRAGYLNKTNIEDKTELLTELLYERAREFVGEGKRWYDLVRVSRRDVANRKDFIVDAVLLNVPSRYIVGVKSKINDPDSWFLPIHESELELNNQLEQNPFYNN